MIAVRYTYSVLHPNENRYKSNFPLHRPSPESDTRPSKLLKFGSLRSAIAVKSTTYRIKYAFDDLRVVFSGG
ncbi:hypothetical protein H1Q63_29070 [Desmonostoc muscorum CCALA 125]|nr:hypothetical protein [Desmonostoc muscorum CCALA 125]